MKKLVLGIALVLVSVVAMLSFAACGSASGDATPSNKMDGYYMIDFEYSKVTVGGVTRNLPDYLAWQEMSFAEYAATGACVTIRISFNYMVIYYEGEILADGTFSMDSGHMVLSPDFQTMLFVMQIQSLKYENGRVNVVSIRGAYTHNLVFSKV